MIFDDLVFYKSTSCLLYCHLSKWNTHLICCHCCFKKDLVYLFLCIFIGPSICKILQSANSINRLIHAVLANTDKLLRLCLIFLCRRLTLHFLCCHCYICFFHVFSSIFDKKRERTGFPIRSDAVLLLVVCDTSIASANQNLSRHRLSYPPKYK